MGDYAAFNVKIRNRYGVIGLAGAGVSVKVRVDGAGADAAESPLTTDVNGQVAAGSIAGQPAGTHVHFRVEFEQGGAGSGTQVLT